MKTTRVDRRKNILTYQSWVYGLYLNKNLVYVGVTADPAGRLVSHRDSKDFDEMRLIRGFSSRDKAEEYENLCIQSFGNLLNIVRKEPKPVGFKPVLLKISDYELSGWKAAVGEGFDFDSLNNKSIARRRRWEARNGRE